ncbi:DUF6506 family protein [Pseudonocardia spirodelae]|uniref:DUF6506 family protein n=1 Tax=Pseudonocardia spirodelae TaxID=3133431 RepID=A0ABU8T556_9PSEU
MTIDPARWAYLFEHPGADPARDVLVLDSPAQRSVIVGVPDTASAPAVAATLVREEGITLVELCGGFGAAAVAEVAAAVGPGIAVGAVTFGPDQVAAATAYSAVATRAAAAVAERTPVRGPAGPAAG